MIEDRSALDQHLAIVEHQRRHPPQRIVRRDLVGIAERRPRPMLERQIIEMQRNSHAADERGIELADQDHGFLMYLERIYSAACQSFPLAQLGKQCLAPSLLNLFPLFRGERSKPEPTGRANARPMTGSARVWGEGRGTAHIWRDSRVGWIATR